MAKNIKVDNLEELAKIIHSKRIALHLSAHDLAVKSNVNVRTIEDIEALRSSPNFREQTLVDLAKVLNLDLLNLLDGNPVKSRDSSAQFGRFADAVIHLESKIFEGLSNKETISLKWLGVTMAYGGAFLEQLINRVIETNPRLELELEIIMLDPAIEQLRSIKNPWLKSHQRSINLIKSIFDQIKKNNKVYKLGLYLYTDVPDYHGFMLNNTYLYWSQCTYDSGNWVVSENPYHLVDMSIAGDRINEKTRFMSWYEYCKQIDCLS